MKPFLILGTAQFGQRYGIANTNGQPDQSTANAIVHAAIAGGITAFDTAQGYGQSEAVLGTALRQMDAGRPVNVITKLSPALSDADAAKLPGVVRGSMERLGVSRLYCCMFHREEHLPLLDGLAGAELVSLKEKQVVQKIGISVYTQDAAKKALRHPAIDIVQIPASLFDRRFETAGVFELARESGKEVHIRSVLLQGVLCMEPSSLPGYLKELVPALEKWRQLCKAENLIPASAALAFACRRWSSSAVLFGAETPRQVKENIQVLNGIDATHNSFFEGLADLFPPQKSELLDPSCWGK